jgi:hypothetical protein
MIKLIGLTFLAINLTGCVVADMDSSNYDFVPYIKTIQKSDSLGHTDPVQRKKDIYSCGVSKNIDPDSEQWSRSYIPPGETIEEHRKRISRIEDCLEQKGYVLLDFRKCGPLKAPTGLCN